MNTQKTAIEALKAVIGPIDPARFPQLHAAVFAALIEATASYRIARGVEPEMRTTDAARAGRDLEGLLPFVLPDLHEDLADDGCTCDASRVTYDLAADPRPTDAPAVMTAWHPATCQFWDDRVASR